MKVIISNRLENLVEELAGQLEKPLSGALMPETIVVQSAGMAKWISLQLALRHGVAANYHFPFPNAFVEEIFSAFIPEYIKNSFFDESVLTWKIMAILPELKNQSSFSTVREYLGEANEQKRLYQLAVKIARIFDQYLIFRPDMILGWEKGMVEKPDEEWQAILWRKILETQGPRHKASLRRKLMDAMQNEPCRPAILPERLSVFGISYLPPYHLDILVKLAAHLPVNYYYLNPSREFWADIRSGQEINRVMRKISRSRPDLNDHVLHLETGNSLLATWGAQGRDFFRLMEEMPVEYDDLFSDSPRKSILDRVQDDIYRLREPQLESGEKEKIPEADATIQIHACHSPIREVETLHDALLNLFEKSGDIQPEDVLVMTPDIEIYAPCIEAVFETREPKIPYSIADRSALASNSIAGGLLSVLQIAESRYKVSDIMALLDNPAIAEKYDMTPEKRELLHHWIEQTFIRWGIDEEHRGSFGLPMFGQNTWRHGLDRLLAGIVFDGRNPDLYAGILPYGDIESEQTEVLGQFLTFWEKLVELKNVLCALHSLEEWCDILQQILADYFPASDAYRNERYLIQQVINGLFTDQTLAGCKISVELGVIRSYLKEALGKTGSGGRFLDGGVSFCAMLPMRSIPFSVICLLGMNSDAYPRRDGKTGFNVMEIERRTGDRSLRNDDQYLFLESVLSARKYLIISYVGLSQTDNSAMLPSVVVSDLMDYLDRNYAFANNGTILESVVRNHRLHAFSPDYFIGKDQNLFSYSQSNYLSACAITDAGKRREDFLKEDLSRIQPWERTISIQDLIKFYIDPVRYFVEQRLCMKLPDNLWSETIDSEPFRIDALNAYRIKMDLIENRLQNGDEQCLLELKKAEGILPVGVTGEYLFNQISQDTAAFTRNIVDYLKSEPLEKYCVNLSLDEDQITGTLDGIRRDYRLSYRPAKLKMKDYLNAWIAHVVLNAAAPEDYPQTSLLLGEDGLYRFDPLPNAREILKMMIRYYRLGHTRPVKLFARSSWVYASALWQKNKTTEEALDAARLAWGRDDNGRMQADSEEIACRICFEDSDPIDDDFQKTAEDILKELFSQMKKEGT